MQLTACSPRVAGRGYARLTTNPSFAPTGLHAAYRRLPRVTAEPDAGIADDAPLHPHP